MSRGHPESSLANIRDGELSVEHPSFDQAVEKQIRLRSSLRHSESEEKIDPRAFRPVAIAPLSEQKRKELRGVIERMTAERARAAKPSPLRLYDAAYDEFMTALNEDETPVGVAGRATLKVEPASDD